MKQSALVTNLVAVFAATVLAGDPSFSTWHGDASLSGFVTNAVPDSPVRLWRFPADGQVEYTPVFGDAKVFFINSKSTIFAVDMLKGTKVWSRTLVDTTGDSNTPPRSISVSAPIAFGSGIVVAASSDGDVFALNAKDGNLLWQKLVSSDGGISQGSSIMSAPNFVTIGAERLLVAILCRSGGGSDIQSTVSALDATNGNRVWETPDPYPQVDGHISVHGNLLAFGSCGSAIHLVSVANGADIGAVELGDQSQVAGGVAIVGKRVYSGSRCGSLYCVNSATRKVEWTFPSDASDLFTTPAANEENVIIGTDRGTITAVDAKTGKEKWVFDSGGNSAASPVIAGDRVVASVGGSVYVLNIKDGKKELWKYSVGDRATSPAVREGIIVVGSDDGYVSAFGAKSARTGETK